MPGKLIGFIVTLLIIVTFIGFNIENSSDIRIWFGDNGLLTDVPIFVSFFIMYLIGVLSVIPFLLGWNMKKDRSAKEDGDEGNESQKDGKKNVRVLGSRKRKEKKSRDEENADDVPEEKETGETVSTNGNTSS